MKMIWVNTHVLLMLTSAFHFRKHTRPIDLSSVQLKWATRLFHHTQRHTYTCSRTHRVTRKSHPFIPAIWHMIKYMHRRYHSVLDVQTESARQRNCSTESSVIAAQGRPHKYTFIVSKSNLVVGGFDTSLLTIYWYSMIRLRCKAKRWWLLCNALTMHSNAFEIGYWTIAMSSFVLMGRVHNAQVWISLSIRLSIWKSKSTNTQWCCAMCARLCTFQF